MQNILSDYSDTAAVKDSIKKNWENYHYLLGRAPGVELSIGRHLTWLITSMPDHFMNLVVCTSLPEGGLDELVEDALSHFKSLHIRKLSWLAEEGVPALELKNCLMQHGLTFKESFAVEMAVDLNTLPGQRPATEGFEIFQVEGEDMLRQWIHIASAGFGVPAESEEVWFEFFNYAACRTPFQTYLGLLNGEPVATSQLCLSAGVAGIYNVTTLPSARGRGAGTAMVMAPLLAAREHGCRAGILQSSKMGYRVYQKLGFQDFGGLSVYLWEQDAKT
jgi:GNAT superfamily N-acetyltransferase